jgi:hypothetical protein
MIGQSLADEQETALLAGPDPQDEVKQHSLRIRSWPVARQYLLVLLLLFSA